MIRTIRHTRPLLSVSLVAMLFTLNGSADADSIWLSQLDVGKAQQDFGKPQKDLSVDRHPLTLAGKTYAHGLGTHASGVLCINLTGAATRFSAVVGLDADAGKDAEPVAFRVVGDDKLLWASGTVVDGSPPQSVDVDVTGVKVLKLWTDSTTDNARSDHVDWADARIEYTGQAPMAIDLPTPLAVILTPPAPDTPRINGAPVFGVRPGSPVLYTIAATGARPMTFTADGLPTGLTLDAKTGSISGHLGQAGEHLIKLHATNSLGTADRDWRLVVGDTIALTPPMGWNSWNCWGEKVDGAKVLESANAMVTSSLVNHGWSYVNIDDTWQGVRGGAFNAIQPDATRFPDIEGLCDQVHALGLKIGIYSSPWIETYGGRIGGSADNLQGNWMQSDRHAAKNKHVKPYDVGTFSFAQNDAKQWAAWGIDYLKYDWGPVDVKNTAEMGDALHATGRDVVYSLSNNAAGNVFDIAADLAPHANAWRITGDINDSWRSLSSIGLDKDRWAAFQKPGHYNDFDMLVVGIVGWGKSHPTKLTADEQYAHLSLWSLLGAPLLIGCDLKRLDPFTLNLLTNDEVLAIDQDPLCRQATCVARHGKTRVFAKPLADGSLAVGIFNLDREETRATVTLAELGIKSPKQVRDVWRQKDLGTSELKFDAVVPAHGVALFRLSAPAAATIGGPRAERVLPIRIAYR